MHSIKVKVLNIAVNTRLLLHGRLEGIGWFTYENLKRMVLSHPEHTFYFIFDRPFHQSFIFSENVKPIVIGPQARHPLLYFLWFEISIRYVLWKIKADIFFSPDGYLSLGSKVKAINVFHDLNFEHYPKDLPLAERFYYRTFFKRYARKASRIATVSEYSKQDIIKQYNINPALIDVVNNGANEAYKPVDEEIRNITRKKYTQGRPYFFFIGSLHPRKNLVNLFRAFDLFKENDKQDHVLLIVGAKKWWTGEIADVFNNMKFKDLVFFTGRLETDEIKNVMGSAAALTYVSYFEGFGIPIVEAFRCGTPVISSNVTSMPEVCGDAALLVNPFQPDDIARAMRTVVTDKALANKLISNGYKRAEIFTWDKSSERLWNCIEKAIQP